MNVEKQFGKYILTGRLGGGGMAEVFRARFTGPGGFEKNVAIKLILPSFSNDPEFVQMFMQEANLSAQLDHANIVRIYEFDQIEGRYFIVMELVDGRDLRQILLRCRDLNRKLAVPEVLMIGMEICKGLAFAHGELRRGAPEIVHRDISPHNVILSSAGEIKITDFGIAKLSSASSHTKAGLVKGKVGYMSPEQARGEQVDRRSDIFALGCVLWELLAGQRLFTGDSDQVILYNLHNTPVKPASSYNVDVGGDIDELLKGLLQRNPDERIGSASKVMREIENIMTLHPEIQRGTMLSNLYRELFSGLPETPDTQVLELHKTVSDQAKEWFERATVTPVSNEIDRYDQRTVHQSSPNQQSAAAKETLLLTEEQLNTLAKRWSIRKMILVGLAICCGGVLIGMVGYKIWDQHMSYDSLVVAPDREPIAAVSSPEKESHPVGATTVDSSAPPATLRHIPAQDPSMTAQPDMPNQQPTPKPPDPEMRKKEPTVLGAVTNDRPIVTSATDSSSANTGTNVNAATTPKSDTVVLRQESKKKSPERSDKETNAIAANKGQLQIITIPPSLVYLGNKLLGSTMLDIALPAGDYTLRLVDKNNKDKTRSVKITINPGKVTRHRFVLE